MSGSPKNEASPKSEVPKVPFVKEGYWDKDEYVAYGCLGKEIRLPYELRDNCGFRASEIRDLVWAFKLYDIIGEKSISTVDARKALKHVGEECNDQVWLDLINAADPHPRGVLNFQGFVKLAKNFKQDDLTDSQLTNAFKIFDKDKSGTIDAIELKDVLEKLGFPITAMEAHDMLAEADDSGDGEVSYSEFVTKIMKAK
jgi:calmodulin